MHITCDWCGTDIVTGNTYYETDDGFAFCSEDCWSEWIYSQFQPTEKVLGEDDRF